MGKLLAGIAEDLTLYARQAAWLNSALVQKAKPGEKPDDDEWRDPETRRSQMLRDGQAPEMPELPTAGAHLVTYLFQAGPVVPGASGACAVSWQELGEWSRLTATPLTPWEAITLQGMSSAYAAELHRASNPKAPAPYTTNDPRKKRQAVASKVRSIFGARARESNPTE